MKKVLSVLLATLMLLTLLMPLSVFAKNGPYPVDWDNMTEEDWENLETISMISVMDYETYEIGYLYPEFMSAEMPVAKKGISYDVKTNTLTLNNYKSNEMLMMSAMGDDFKIKVSGYNEIGCIGSLDLGWGGSITVTGNGVLVVNNNKTYPAAVSMDVSGTGYGFFKTEKSVAVKLIGNIDTDLGEAEPTIYVSGSKEADSSKVIMLNGDVKASEANKSESYDYVEYVQTEVLWVDEYYGFGDFYTSEQEGLKGKLYIGEESYEEDLYYMYEVVYDEELKNYVAIFEEDLEDIYLDEFGFTKVSGDTTVPATILEIDFEPIELDTCIDENDKVCVFFDYSDEEAGEDIEVYEIVEHSKYGKLALMNNPKSTYKELKVASREKYYDHTNESTTITTNTIVTKVPGKVTLKKAASAFGGVNVTWNAVSGADSYTIYRKVAGAKSWSTLGTSKTTSYLDKTAKTGTKYTYTVRAKNIIGLGSYDSTGVSTTYIAAPTAKIANASNGIKVSWNKISGATGYTVYRSQYSGGKWSGWKNMGTAKADKSSWTDKSVKSGVQYRYTVRTVSGKSVSSFKATSGLVYLSTPTVKIANASTGVKVSWNKISGAKNYIVYRSEYASGKWSGWKKISTVGAVTSTVDKTAKSGVYYKYTVKAVNGSSTGAFKASSQLFYLAQPTTKITNASNGIKVSWTKSAGSKGYTVYRSEYVNGKWSSWKTMGTAAATKTSWTDKSVKAGVQYKYTVRAVNGKVKSTFTATSGLVRLAQPAVKATLNENSVKVSWNKISGAKSYTVYRSALVDGKWTSWATVSSQTATSFVDNEVTEGVTYRYTVRAVNGKSLSSFVASANVIIPATQEDVA
ncbi:MAG: hypothetical protein IJN49_09745 [Clostridia bacterium]|nr:hypothetical protein [Clostridia bacterium]